MDTESSTLQKIFNKAWQHFIVENNLPAVREDDICQYLTIEGRKCAIGLCIPDGHPAQNYGGSFGGLVNKYPDLFPGLVDMDEDYVNEFQKRLHDDLQADGEWLFSKEEMKNEYLAVAKDYRLTIPEQSRA